MSVRKMTALPVKIETETLIGKDRICVLTDISRKMYFIRRHLTFWVLS